MCCLRIARVCAGGDSYSDSFVGRTISVSGRSPSTSWSSQCTADSQTQRTGYAAVASSWLTVPCAHDSGPDFRRPAGTLTVKTRPPAAQDSLPGLWTACADSLASRPGHVCTCQAMPCTARVWVPRYVVWDRMSGFTGLTTDLLWTSEACRCGQ